ncbi:MAG TPA: glycine--tRNA ligase [Candidatus Peribacteraceae bacterium]|nr:glycine--tRNA ligase [Candidatus Peribacteraceae bacterium]
MPAPSLDALVSLCKRRGFIFPGSEIYGGLANTWDYGPLGVELKNRVKKQWWKKFVHKRMDMVGLDASILMNQKVWEASGHIGSFTDLMSTCKFCKRLVRADHWYDLLLQSEWYKSLQGLYFAQEVVTLADLKKWGEHKAQKLAPNLAIVRNPSVTISWLAEFLEKASKVAEKGAMIESSLKELAKYLATEQLEKDGLQTPCPFCGGVLTEPKPFNLLFKTHQGVIENEGTTVYLRPETAQGIFVNFRNIADTSRMRLPFGVGQIGKAFRNEITPGNFIFRTREFEQMEIEYFFDPEKQKWEDIFEEWKKASWEFITKTLGITEASLRLRDHEKDELSHYSKGTTDIEFKFPWGWGELCAAAAYRTDYDLTQHQKFSGQDLRYTDPDNAERKFLPHVMEPSFGSDRITLAVMLDAYTEEKINDDTRIVMRFAPAIAPVDVAILPLSKKEHLLSKAQELYKKIIHETDLVCDFDVTGSIGKRYRRQDEIGTPKCITVDFGTLGEDDAQGERETVTIRDRDTLKQERVTIDSLIEKLRTSPR